jgi:hypothetical protein
MTQPLSIQPLGLTPSFGFGDRLGAATPGHVAALKAAGQGIAPIFPQQSIREMARTVRTPEQVMADAQAGASAAGFSGVSGADADHLKTPDDVNRTAAAGFVFFTIDPSDHVDGHADRYSDDELAAKFKPLAGSIDWIGQYKGKYDEKVLQRCAVKYGKAIEHAAGLARHIDAVMAKAGKKYEIELSVDETPEPTTPAEHFIVIDQCQKQGMKHLVSVAPRFVGEFEKGIDFKGDMAAFEGSLAQHAQIARDLGPYKLSLHSGSDKLSIYTAFARATQGVFHVKTAGTSYLEALRVVARHDPKFFRELVVFARGKYETDKATYHVSATLGNVPESTVKASDAELEEIYLGTWAKVPAGKGFTGLGRQILHCTFGSTLQNAAYKSRLFELLKTHAGTYADILQDHFARHLKALRAGMK